jgi:hypothetical protein
MRIAPIAASAALLSFASAAHAGFGGQIILGPLGPGSNVTGDNTFSNDDNDGFTSGTHIFFIWDGGDDAWALDWPGGNLRVDMIYNTALGDPDLFLYTPDNYDDSSIYSITNTGLDTVSLAGAAAGRYYLVVDSSFGAEGPYQLVVTPTPAAAALLGVSALVIGRRRR